MEDKETQNHSETQPSPQSPNSSDGFSIQKLGPFAVDIGGSFTKLVYWRPPNPPPLPHYIIKEFSNTVFDKFLKPDPSLKVSFGEQGTLRFLKFPSDRTPEFIQFSLETKLNEQYGPDKTKVVNATGGGAYKYDDLVQKKLGTTMKQLDEMQCLIRGLSYLLLNTDNESFTYNWKDGKKTFITRNQAKVTDPDYPFPFLLVNVGSGVSILKVTSPTDYQRVSGSSIGGGTFWGLCKLLTNIQSFDEVQQLSQSGDNKNVDLLVGDIYGGDYPSFGLNADIIASSFGRIAVQHETPSGSYKKEDIIRSLLFMLSNNIAQIGYLNAKQHNVKRVYFAGGFLQENPYLWTRFSYAINFWSKGEMEAFFLTHNTYLGALGALLDGWVHQEK